VSLCEEKQVKNFLKMVKDAGIEGVEELSNSDEKLESLGDKFAECLEVLKEMLEKEREGKEEIENSKQASRSKCQNPRTRKQLLRNMQSASSSSTGLSMTPGCRC